MFNHRWAQMDTDATGEAERLPIADCRCAAGRGAGFRSAKTTTTHLKSCKRLTHAFSRVVVFWPAMSSLTRLPIANCQLPIADCRLPIIAGVSFRPNRMRGMGLGGRLGGSGKRRERWATTGCAAGRGAGFRSAKTATHCSLKSDGAGLRAGKADGREWHFAKRTQIACFIYIVFSIC